MLYMATLNQLKAELGIKDIQDNVQLQDLAEGMQSRFDGFCNRRFTYAADEVEIHDGGVSALELQRFPIVSVASVHLSDDQEWTNSTLVPTTSYVAHLERGLIFYRIGFKQWYSGQQNIRVQYTGGYRADNVPEDLKRAFRMQVCFEWRNRTTLGMQSMSAGGVSSTFAPADLLAEVKSTLLTYRRF